MFAATVGRNPGDTTEIHLQGWKNEVKALQHHTNHSKIYSAHRQAFFKFVVQQAFGLETDNALQENSIQFRDKITQGENITKEHLFVFH